MALAAKRVAKLRARPEHPYGDGHPAVPMMISRTLWLARSRSAANHGGEVGGVVAANRLSVPPPDVRYPGCSGPTMLALSITAYDPSLPFDDRICCDAQCVQWYGNRLSRPP
jgi:hypothetical protein